MTVWQRRWRLSTAAIAVVVEGGVGGIEPTAPSRVANGGSG
jgi:hypothetical protein